MKNNKGITIIILIIIIIVIMILVGVGLVILIRDDGILVNKGTLVSIEENPLLYYGGYVDYKVDLDGNIFNNDWQIYYSDGENIYLIGNQIVLNCSKGGSGGLIGGYVTNLPNPVEYYSIRGSENGNFVYLSNDDFREKLYSNEELEEILNSIVAKKWLGTYYNAVGNEKTIQSNSYSLAYLFDMEIWYDKYIKGNSKLEKQTEYMLGGLPVELLALSYNKTHSKSNQKRIFLDSNKNGYIYALEVNKPDNLMSEEYQRKFGYGIAIAKSDDFNGIYTNNYSYWLASPIYFPSISLMSMTDNGKIYLSEDSSIRPVVCLKSNVQIEVPSGDNVGTVDNPYKLK